MRNRNLFQVQRFRITSVEAFAKTKLTMAFAELIITFGVISISSATPVETPAAAATLTAAPALPAIPDAYPMDNFGYAVNDPITGDAKAHSEVRDGDMVQGSYSYVGADGHVRTVDWHDTNGFNVAVSKHPRELPLTSSRIAIPLVRAAAPVIASEAVVPDKVRVPKAATQPGAAESALTTGPWLPCTDDSQIYEEAAHEQKPAHAQPEYRAIPNTPIQVAAEPSVQHLRPRPTRSVPNLKATTRVAFPPPIYFSAYPHVHQPTPFGALLHDPVHFAPYVY
nr:PREDICTED: cuticle protein-like [Bemisia tabaci]